MKHDRYFIACSLFLASFVLSALVQMEVFMPLNEAYLMDWISWILGTAGILMFALAIQDHHKGTKH